jgi:DNA-binding transcriptional LysR family regulator
LAKSINTTLRVRVHAPNFDSVIRCVHNGAGIALVPYSVAERDILAGNIGFVHIHEPWAIRRQQLVTKNSDDLPEYALQLISAIVVVNTSTPDDETPS